MTRAEKVLSAQQLRAQGLLLRDICEVMGAGRSAVSTWLCDPDLSKQHARRARYSGECEQCGFPTDGSNGPGRAPKLCARCAPKSEEYRLAHTKWTRERIIASIQWWNDEYGEPPAVPDWNPHYASQLGDHARAERGRALIEAGVVPWFTAVFNRFGSWNAGIEAAGFVPRQPTGGGGNIFRRRDLRAKQVA